MLSVCINIYYTCKKGVCRKMAAWVKAISLGRLWRCCSTVSYPLRLAAVSPDHEAIYRESLRNPDIFWGELAKERLRWIRPFDEVSDCNMVGPKIKWFRGGKINVSGTKFVIKSWSADSSFMVS